MPFGLVNAPATFQRAMSLALRGCEEFTAVYLDDILIFSENRETHLKHLRQVFECLNEHVYHVRLAKYTFCETSVPFLGHTLTPEGITASEKRHTVMSAFQPPFVSVKQLRAFLGVVMWYKNFIPHVASIAAPLFEKTSKRKLVWDDEATRAVNRLKGALIELLMLVRFDRELQTRVTTDASTVGVAAVLEQRHGDDWRPVAFWSRKLKDAETRYSATDLEWLAVVESVSRVWRHFLEDLPFCLRSDHCALERKATEECA